MLFAVLPLSAHPLAKLFPKYGEAELLDVGATSPPMAAQSYRFVSANFRWSEPSSSLSSGRSYDRTSDADIIAVRFPHVFEPTGGQQDDWDEQFERWGLRLIAETIGLIVERQGYLKGHLAARHWRVPYAIRRLGMFTEQEAQNVASALCDQKITGQRGFAVAKFLVGTTDLPGQSWLYLHLDDAAK